MSQDFDDNILRKKYRATVAEGRLRFSEPVLPSKAFGKDYGIDYFNVEYIHSVQVDLHPADFNRLTDTLEYIHGSGIERYHSSVESSKANWPFTAQTPYEQFMQETYRKQEFEERMRAQHPLLQDLWNQYQMTLNLLVTGKEKDQ